MAAAKKVIKSTSRGQITLPKKWRTHFATNSYLLEMRADRLIVIPFDVDNAHCVKKWR